MGLDITAYKNLVKVKNPLIDEYGDLINWDTEWIPGASMEWSEKHFPGRGEGIDVDSVYTWEEKFDFRAGSYSGYGWWRRTLDKFRMGYLDFKRFSEDNPFEELINFADNEGVIGYVVASKLYNDLLRYEKDAEKFSKTLFADGDWWFDKYKEWKRAFEFASQNGAVDFH